MLGNIKGDIEQIKAPYVHAVCEYDLWAMPQERRKVLSWSFQAVLRRMLN